MEKKLRIGVDCRLAGRQHAGIGRYIQNLITRLPQVAPHIEWVYFFHDATQAQEVLPDRSENVKIVFAPFRHYSSSEQLHLPVVFRQAELDLLHIPHFNVPLRTRQKIVVTIHDLLWHEYKGAAVTTLPKWQYWLKYGVYRHTVNHAVRHAKQIIVPAETIRSTIIKYYPSTADKITVTKEGIDDSFWLKKPAGASNLSRQLIYVGSLYPHKNVRLIFDSLLQLPEYTLLIVGTRNVFQEQLRQYVAEHHLEKQVKFLGYVPDDQLRDLYQSCAALVQPSLSEGFGLTGVEAMAAQLPVLASEIPIFQEIYQDAAFYFDPRLPERFISAVRALEKADRTQVTRRGRQIAEQYSWESMAKQTWQVYQKALS